MIGQQLHDKAFLEVGPLGIFAACRGFILTGAAAGADTLLETSLPGVFAAGDVRSGSTKRCW